MAARRMALRACAAAVGLGAMLAPPASAAAPHRLFVSGFGVGTLASYAVDGATGSLSRLGSVRGTGNTQEAVVVSPDGRFVAMANRAQQGSIAIWEIAGGSLRPVSGSPFSTRGIHPVGLAFTPDGRHLYATNYDSRNVAAFGVGGDGVLTPVPGAELTRTAGVNPIGIAVAPDGRHLYVTHYGSGTLAGFSIGANGALTALPGSPWSARGAGPTGIAVTPDGKYLYTQDFYTSTVSGFAIGADGVPAPLPQQRVRTGGTFPLYLEISRDGRFVYVPNLLTGATLQGGVSTFRIGDAGALVRLADRPAPTGGLLSQAMVIAPDMRTMYVANRGSGDVSRLAVAADGSVRRTGGRTSIGAASPGYQGLAITPDQSPVAMVSAEVDGATVRLSGAGSTDPDGRITRYDWDFGDGTSADDGGAAPVHTYARAGSFTVRLTVTDDEGCSAASGFTGRTAPCAGAERAISRTVIAVP